MADDGAESRVGVQLGGEVGSPHRVHPVEVGHGGVVGVEVAAKGLGENGSRLVRDIERTVARVCDNKLTKNRIR